MTFRSRHLCWAAKLNKRRHRDTFGNQPHFRHLFSTCQVGYLNVCTLRHVFNVSPDGSLFLRGFAEIEILKQRMQDHSLYALCMSEVRLFGAGSVDVGNGFTLVYQGSPGDGSHGGCGILLSPAGSKAWRLEKVVLLAVFCDSLCGLLPTKVGGICFRCMAQPCSARMRRRVLTGAI